MVSIHERSGTITGLNLPGTRITALPSGIFARPSSSSLSQSTRSWRIALSRPCKSCLGRGRLWRHIHSRRRRGSIRSDCRVYDASECHFNVFLVRAVRMEQSAAERHHAIRTRSGDTTGLTFVVAVAFLAPAAYYPTYLATAGGPPLKSFLRQWFCTRRMPSGPAWFIWILLAFDCLAAGFFLMMPEWGDGPAAVFSLFSSPARFFWTLAAVPESPMSQWCSPSSCALDGVRAIHVPD